MNFTEEEIAKIERWSKKEPLIQRMLDEIKSYHEDIGKKFYKTISETASILTSELELMNSGNKGKNLKFMGSDAKIYKRVYDLVSNSKKIIESLDYSKKVLSGQPKTDSEEYLNNDFGSEEISYADRKADELNKQKK